MSSAASVSLNATVMGPVNPRAGDLLMLHGLFGSARNWYSIQKKLTQPDSDVPPAWRVHALDLRNHGESDHASTMTYQQMSGDVLSYMDGQGLDKVALLGHSMGGKVAMTLALQSPARISKLIVVDIAPVTYAPTLGGYLAALRQLDLHRLDSRRHADEQLRDAVPDAGIRGFLLQSLVPEPAALDGHPAWRWRLNLAAIADALNQLGEFTETARGESAMPACSIYGERSEYMAPQHVDALRQCFPGVGLHPIADAGHWVHAEQPAAFLDALRRCLQNDS